MPSEQKTAQQIFEDYSFSITDKLFDECDGELSKLNQLEIEVVRIWRLEADMYNGGFIQFFCNWGYDNFVETQKVLQKIKATQILKLITESESLIVKAKDDDRVKELWDIPTVLEDYLTATELDRLEKLDELYWEDPDDIQQLAFDCYLKTDT